MTLSDLIRRRVLGLKPLRLGTVWASLVGLACVAALAGCGRAPVHVSQELANPALYTGPDNSFIDTCNGCHASDGLSAGSPPRPVPRLRGQQAVYLASALRAYRDGSRADPTMREAAGGLTDDQIDRAARILAGVAQSAAPPPPPQGPAPPMVVQGVCAGCHGQTGLGVVPDYPKIGGQHQAYLKAALEDYRTGRRSNPIMRTFAMELSPAQVEDVTAYFATRGGLSPAKP